MNNLLWMAIGFFVAVGLAFVFMPRLAPMFMPSENQTETKTKLSPKAIGIMLLVPIVAGLLYAKLGTPQATSVSVPSEAISTPTGMPPMADNSKHEMGDFSTMAAKLAAKLEKNPNDGEGWALLARSYVELKQHKDAVPAFEKAIAILPNDPQLLADYVDARAVTQGHQLDEKSAELVNKALKLDPNLPKALLLAGTLAFDKGDYKKAIEIWEHLHSTLKSTDSPELVNEVTTNIAEAQAALAVKK